MLTSVRSTAVRSIASVSARRFLSSTRIIANAANIHADSSDVSHFATFKEYRVFAQQFGPLASHAWAKNLAAAVPAASIEESAAAVLDSIVSQQENDAILSGGASD